MYNFLLCFCELYKKRVIANQGSNFCTTVNCILSKHLTGKVINNRFKLFKYEINRMLLRCHLRSYR